MTMAKGPTKIRTGISSGRKVTTAPNKITTRTTPNAKRTTSVRPTSSSADKPVSSGKRK